MHKAVALLFLLASGSFAGISKPTITRIDGQLNKRKEEASLCPLCVSFTGQFINELLNIVLNAGVIGTCGELCQLLDEKVHSQVVEDVCNILCDVAGVEAFIHFIDKADLDPIYYCELVRLCPIKDDGDATINSITVQPDTVRYGSTFKIVLDFTSKNGTGTGEIYLLINTVDGIPLGDVELMNNLAPGSYSIDWKVDAKRNPNCDPTQGPCEEWLAGNYTANLALCNGECGSKHPHSQVYDTGKEDFSVTKG